MLSSWSLWSTDSVLSLASDRSVLSVGSSCSFGSIGSVGSFASVLSVGSSASAVSVLSNLSLGSTLSHDARGAVLSTGRQRGGGAGPLSWVTAGALAVTAMGVLLSLSSPARGHFVTDTPTDRGRQ